MKKDAPLNSAFRKEQKHGKGKENVEHRLKAFNTFEVFGPGLIARVRVKNEGENTKTEATSRKQKIVTNGASGEKAERQVWID